MSGFPEVLQDMNEILYDADVDLVAFGSRIDSP
jgi:hypothetical protein